VKNFAYRGSREEFSNVYTFDVPAPSISVCQDIISRLVSIEMDIHSSGVQFVSARAWTSGGTPAQNETIIITDLAGPGTQPPAPEWHAQAVYEIQWRTDRPSVTDKPVYLRKYLRSFSVFNVTASPGVFAGSTPLPELLGVFLQRYADAVNPLVTTGADYRLIAPSGRRVTRAADLPRYTSIHELRY
jgi:hypothetical protein